MVVFETLLEDSTLIIHSGLVCWFVCLFKIPCAIYPYSLFILYIVLCISWPYLIAQLEKNPYAMQETRVGFPGWEDPMEKG